MDTSLQQTTVVIIGAGISGLSAAKVLKENGLKVVVLEARDRVGGRTYTLRDPAYGYTDVGGAYVGPTQRRVARLAKELGLTFYKVDDKDKTILKRGGTVYQYHGQIPNIWDPIKAMDLNDLRRKIDAMAQEIPPEAPWSAPNAELWDSMTLQQFMDQTCWTSLSKHMALLISRGLFCVEPSEISLLNFLWYMKTGQGLSRLLETTDGAQERKFHGGAQKLSEKLAENVGMDKVNFKSPVIKVEQTESTVKVTSSGGDVYEGEFVISSIPQALLNRVTFHPPLPPKKIQLIQRMPMGSIIKTVMFYDKAFWKTKGFCGQATSDDGIVNVCYDDTKPDGTSPAIMGFVLAKEARDWVECSPEKRKDAICKHYSSVFGMEEFLKPSGYVEQNWMEEEYTGGCYTSVMPPGVLSNYGQMIRQPHGKVYWAGSESATYFAGYMEGAIQAGERAAREILYSLGKIEQSEIWQDEAPSEDFPENSMEMTPIEKILPSVGGFLKFCVPVFAALSIGAVRYLTKKYM